MHSTPGLKKTDIMGFKSSLKGPKSGPCPISQFMICDVVVLLAHYVKCAVVLLRLLWATVDNGTTGGAFQEVTDCSRFLQVDISVL